MNDTEQHVATAAKMYECRATARRLLGEKYPQHMREIGSVIRTRAQIDKCNDIVAGATIIKETGAQGMDVLLIMAAVVEMTEPSNVEVTGDRRPEAEGDRQAQLDGRPVDRRVGHHFGKDEGTP